METYRITKYDPNKRNKQGYFASDHPEWTSVSDIGKKEYGYITYEDYERTETAYVDAIMLILKAYRLEYLKVEALELYRDKQGFEHFEKEGMLSKISFNYDKDVANLKNGLALNLIQLDKVIRLILRESMWMLLIGENLEVRFGYDYYMYVKVANIEEVTIQRIHDSGLFVEKGFELDVIYSADSPAEDVDLISEASESSPPEKRWWQFWK